ncbi:MAG: hypothetical protein P1V51_06055 [Deltaproteobacteria bacterium]|nr:hypothetical protein [Deltaproteobacteria bacterium]
MEQAYGALTLSPLPRRGGIEGVLRAASWHNLVHRIGNHLPLLICHDLGRLLVEGAPARTERNQAGLELAGLGADPGLLPHLARYEELLQRLGRTEMVQRAPSLQLSDEAVAALIARVFAPVLEAAPPAEGISRLLTDLPVDAGHYLMGDPAHLCAEHGIEPELAFLRLASEHAFRITTAAERIDIDTLRLISLFAGDDSLVGSAAALDVYQILGDPSAADVIHFSLELLPQVLETRRTRGLQRFAMDGVAGVSRRGNPDQLLPSELAYPDDIFAHKVAEKELLFYGHEADRQTERRVHLVLVDASASMRGARAIFGRGLSLTLVKKLILLGEEVEVRFFDSTLHEPARVSAHNFQIPYLLCFQSERGRNYSRVFKALTHELRRRRRLAGRGAAVYFITHGQCHVPLPVMEQLASVARLYGIFVLPDSQLTLEYLPVLHQHRVVQRQDLSESGARRRAALEIVDAVAEAAG